MKISLYFLVQRNVGTGETAQQLRFIIALLVELGPVHSILMLSHIYNSSPKRFSYFSDLLRLLHNKLYIHVLKHTHIIK